MSADNWTVCPKCGTENEGAEERERERRKALYGTIPMEEWEALNKKPLPQDEPEDTLREDYEIGIWDGKFFAKYSGYCTNDDCDFQFEFNHEEQIEPAANPDPHNRAAGPVGR